MDDKKSGKIVSFEQFQAARAARLDDVARAAKKIAENYERTQSWPAGCDDPQTLAAAFHAAGQIILTAAKQHDYLFFEGMTDDDFENNKGMKILRGDLRFQLLQAINRDDLKDTMVFKELGKISDFNALNFWHDEDADDRTVHFMRPAHLARSFAMAMYLHRNGADFTLPDSRGRLPMYHMAVRGADSDMFLYLHHRMNISMNKSGRDPVTGDAFESPLYLAVEHGRHKVVHGLERMAPHTDMNVMDGGTGLSPLMRAVMAADEAVDAVESTPRPTRAQQAEMKRRLWIVRFLAASPHVEPDQTNPADHYAAKDFALNNATREALAGGIARRPKPWEPPPTPQAPAP